MTDLLTRLQDATEDSRELDAGIHVSLGNTPPKHPSSASFWHVVPYYTTSIDAALTLVPRGHEWSVGVDLENCKGWAKVGKENWDDNFEDYLSVAPTPALALCIAALQAQQSKAEVA